MVRDAHSPPLLAYLVEQAFPGRRIAWGKVIAGGRGSAAGGDREAFGWPVSRGLPRGVRMTPSIESPGVLRGVPLTADVERADLHLVPSGGVLWCVAVEVTDDDGLPLRRGGQDLGRDLERQDILLHTIVHDLASPLSGIVGCLTALEEEGATSPTEQQRLVGLALRQAHRQERLIQQILDVFRARTDDDGLEDTAQPPNLPAVARRLVENLGPSFALHRVGLRLEDVRPSPRARVVGEETRLERVLANLLDNGLRHAPEGSEVVVRLAGDDEAAEVSVLDAGPGVPSARRGELFQKLRQGESRGKLGLGLYFCRITVQRWGGRIGYADRDGPGARFWFRLPWAREAEEPLRAVSAS